MRGDRLILWLPVALIAGIFGYFALSTEPHWPVFAAVAAVMLALAIWGRSWVALLLVAVLAGFILAKARTEWVKAPALAASTGEVAIAGKIEAIERKGPRASLTLALARVEGISAGAMPKRVRLTVYPKDQTLRPGQEIAAKARLYPLPTPVAPGAHDFGRAMWFAGIGGTGRIVGAVEVTGSEPSLGGWLDDLRQAIGARIRAVLPGATGAFAEAVITGERGTIPKDVNESLQVSGLAHILSISGLHMSLIAGGVFWLVRALLALSPALALRWPIKKWAALAALAAGLFYMLLAGSGVATQRSYIMLAVMFVAILVDRPAISMRNLAIAALIVLAIEPEACLTASFQMSFMAVMGLIALHDLWSEWRRQGKEMRQTRPPAWRAAEWAGMALVAMAATSLAAGLFSSIPAAYHFGRLAPLSLLANLLALPVVSLIVMPMALVSVLLMPLGLEHWPLWLMGEGLRLVLLISDRVASLPTARLLVPAQPAIAVLVISGGAVLLCLIHSRWRLAGLPLAALGIALSFTERAPDVLIERTAANAAIRTADARLIFATSRRGRFAAEKWLIGNGEDVAWREAAKREGWSCLNGLCRAEIKGKRIAYAGREVDLAGRCGELDILISAEPLRGACRSVALRIDRFDVWRYGAHALWIGDGRVAIATARGIQGARPWTVQVKGRVRTAQWKAGIAGASK